MKEKPNKNLLEMFEVADLRYLDCLDGGATPVGFHEKIFESLKEKLPMAKPEEQDTLEVQLVEDEYGESIEVVLLNSRYVCEPEEGLEIWGGNSEDKDDCPDGSYNVNWYGYQKYYGITGLNRDKLLLNKVVITDEAWKYITEVHPDKEIEHIVFSIVLELTFYGFTESECQDFWDELDQRRNFKEDEDELWRI